MQAKKICKRCGKNELNNGHTRCNECLEKQRNYNKKYYETVDKQKRYLARKESGLCTHCGKSPNNGTNYCDDCRRSANEKEIQKRFISESKGLCGICEKILADEGYKTCQKCREKSIKWYYSNGGKEGQKQKIIKMKEIIFEYYGSKCACCGHDDKRFFTIDHVNNDGAEHRRRLTGSKRQGCGLYTYKWIIQNNFPDTIQVLCANCNWGKRMNNGTCPHKNSV